MSFMRTHDLIDITQPAGDLDDFQPRGHVFAAMASEDDARAAEALLIEQGFEAGDCHYIAPDAAETATRHGLDAAAGMTISSNSMRLVGEYNRLARRGYHFLLLRAESDAEADLVEEALRYHDCRLAMRYSQQGVETLI